MLPSNNVLLQCSFESDLQLLRSSVVVIFRSDFEQILTIARVTHDISALLAPVPDVVDVNVVVTSPNWSEPRDAWCEL